MDEKYKKWKSEHNDKYPNISDFYRFLDWKIIDPYKEKITLQKFRKWKFESGLSAPTKREERSFLNFENHGAEKLYDSFYDSIVI